MSVQPLADPSQSFIGAVAVERAKDRAGGGARPVR